MPTESSPGSRRFPSQAAEYRNLESAGDRLYYISSGSKDEKPKLFVYELDKQKETEIGEANGFEISADGKKMLVGASGEYSIIDLPTAKMEMKEHLNLADMKVNLDRRAEWNQIFRECWRQMRDFLYDPHMQGVNWEGVRKKYEVLLPFVNHRADLTYMIGEMISRAEHRPLLRRGRGIPETREDRHGAPRSEAGARPRLALLQDQGDTQGRELGQR